MNLPLHHQLMGQQLNKVEKRRRRSNYLKRLKSRAAAGLTKKRPAIAKGETKDGEAKKKAVKKKVVKKKVVAKAAAVETPVVAPPPPVVETTPVVEVTETTSPEAAAPATEA